MSINEQLDLLAGMTSLYSQSFPFVWPLPSWNPKTPRWMENWANGKMPAPSHKGLKKEPVKFSYEWFLNKKGIKRPRNLWDIEIKVRNKGGRPKTH